MSYTPEEITEILEAYFDSIAHRQYIGSRYVPIFGRVGESSCDWDNTGDYEPLTIVLYQGNSYTSRQFVPAGADISNTDYWVLTGNFNAQVEQYRLRTVALENALPITEFDGTDTVKKYVDDTALDTLDAAKIASAQVFDTVAEMKAADLANGMICHTNGFYVSGDDGAAWYEIKDTGTANEMNVIACGDLFAHLIYGDAVKLEQLGAYGDDSHDDSACFAQAAALVNVVYLNSKTYKINIEIDKSDVCVYGTGQRSTILKPYDTAKPVIKINNHDNHIICIKLGDFYIDGDNANINGIEFGDIGAAKLSDYHVMKNILIQNCTNGIYINSRLINCVFENIECSRNANCGLLIDDGNTVNNNVFNHCLFNSNVNEGIRGVSSTANGGVNCLFFNECNIEGNANSNDTTRLYGVYFDVPRNLVLNESYIENNAYTNGAPITDGAAVYLNGTLGFATIKDCLVWGSDYYLYSNLSNANVNVTGGRIDGKLYSGGTYTANEFRGYTLERVNNDVSSPDNGFSGVVKSLNPLHLNVIPYSETALKELRSTAYSTQGDITLPDMTDNYSYGRIIIFIPLTGSITVPTNSGWSVAATTVLTKPSIWMCCFKSYRMIASLD